MICSRYFYASAWKTIPDSSCIISLPGALEKMFKYSLFFSHYDTDAVLMAAGITAVSLQQLAHLKTGEKYKNISAETCKT